jgi:hypothetical protein
MATPLLALLLAGGAAAQHAHSRAVAELVRASADDPSAPKILGTLPPEARDCTQRGAICMFAGASSTARTQDTAAKVTVLSRAARVAASAAFAKPGKDATWDLMVVANLKHKQ